MPDDLRDTLLETLESALDAQLRAVRRGPRPSPHVGRPYNLIEGIQARFSRAVDRESLVSALSKKIARGDRFVRTAKNTFALRSPD